MAKALNTMIQSGGGLLKSAKSAFDQENEDELKKASKAQGILTPTSPLGASSLGVSPDSQKMAGSGQQKLGISQQVAKLASDNSLAPKEATQEQKTKREQANKLQTMGQAGTGLKDRVNSIILGNIQKQTTDISGDAGVTNSIKRVVEGSGVDAPNQARIQSLLSGNPLASDIEYEELGKALGLNTDALTGKQLSDTLNSKYLVTTSGKLPFALQENLRVSDVAAVNSDNDANTDWVKELKLGFQSEKDLEDFLGIKPAEMAGLTIAQLNEKVDNKVAANFSEIAAAQARLNDPAASMQEKTAARELLTGLGQAGVLGSEQLAQGSTRDTKKANTVTFMGQEWAPSELAKDPIFQNEAAKYYKLTDPAARQAIKDAAKSPSDKAFYDFLDANEKTLKSIQTKSGETLKKVDEDLVKAAGEWQVVPAGLLDDALMERITGQKKPKKIGQSYDKGKETNAAKILRVVNPEQQTAYASFLKQLPASVADDIIKTALDSLRRMQVWDEDPRKLADNLGRWGGYLADQKFLEDPEGNIGTIMGLAGLNEQEAKGFIGALSALKNTGIGKDTTALFDADGDGTIDPTKDIQSRLRTKYQKPKDGWRPGSVSLGDDLRGLIAAAKEGINKLPEPFRDGDVSMEDMDSILNQGIPSWQDYDKLVPSGIRIDKNVKTAAVNRIARNEIKKVLPNADVFLGDGFAGAGEDIGTMENGRRMIQEAFDKLNGMQMDPRGGYELDRLKAAFQMKLAKVDGELANKRAEADRLERERLEKERIQRESDREFKKKQLANMGYAPQEIQTIIETGVVPVLNKVGSALTSPLEQVVAPAADTISSGINSGVNKLKKGFKR